jgi:ankyrin repeat protein
MSMKKDTTKIFVFILTLIIELFQLNKFSYGQNILRSESKNKQTTQFNDNLIDCRNHIDFQKCYDLLAENVFESPDVVAICKAIERHDYKTMDVLKGKININTIGKQGITPLVWAYYSKDILSFQKIISLGANPNIRYIDTSEVCASRSINIMSPGSTFFSRLPIIKHTLSGYYPDYIDYPNICFNLMLVYGANSNEYNPYSGESVLYSACKEVNSEEMIKSLIRFGADVNFQTDEYEMKMTPLLIARTPQIVMLLLNAGADFNIKNSQGKSLSFRLLEIEDCDFINSHPVSNEWKNEWKNVKEFLINHGVNFDDEKKRYQEFKLRRKDNMNEYELYELEKNVLGATYDLNKRIEFEKQVGILTKDNLGQPYYDEYIRFRQKTFGVPQYIPKTPRFKCHNIQ